MYTYDNYKRNNTCYRYRNPDKHADRKIPANYVSQVLQILDIRSIKRENDRYKQIYPGEQDDSDILDKIIEEEANQILIHAIQQLPPQSERIILLTLAGNNVKEIAEILAVSVNTVRTLKYGAIRKLREYFIARDYRAEF